MRIRIKFIDFHDGFDEQENFFVRLLRHRYEVEVHPDAEHAIFSRFGYDFLRHKGVRIFFTTENVRANFDLADYALGFDHITFQDRYLRLPLYRCYEKAYRAALGIPTVAQSAAAREFCSYVVSNRRASRADSSRSEFFHKLTAYRQVASGGKQFNNVGGPVADKDAFLRKYKFNIAFENTSTPGYTTEKIVEAKAAGAVPIYWGDPLIATEFNPKSFINCHDYPDFDAVVARVREIDRDPAQYSAMLSEPLFHEGREPDCLKTERLLDFFANIFERPIEQAYRRVLVGRWGTRTEKEYRYAALLNVKYQTSRLRKRLFGGKKPKPKSTGGSANMLDKASN